MQLSALIERPLCLKQKIPKKTGLGREGRFAWNTNYAQGCLSHKRMVYDRIKISKNYKSPFDASVVEKLKNVGMICLGKTSCDEFAMGSANQNCAYNDCCNPWDQSCIPGGSSGGSAAVVAAGIVPAATGTDTGKIDKMPSAMCGVTGLKPTYGRVSRWGIVAYFKS